MKHGADGRRCSHHRRAPRSGVANLVPASSSTSLQAGLCTATYRHRNNQSFYTLVDFSDLTSASRTSWIFLSTVPYLTAKKARMTLSPKVLQDLAATSCSVNNGFLCVLWHCSHSLHCRCRRDVRYIRVSRQSGFVTSFAITEKLIERRALLFEVQRVTSPRLPRLRCLIALFFPHTAVRTASRLSVFNWNIRDF